MEISPQDLEEKETLVTRAGIYIRERSEAKKESSTATSSSRKSARNLKSRHFKCRFHDSANASGWTEENSSCDSCFHLEHREELPNGILPRIKHVLEYILTLKHVNNGKHVDVDRMAAQDVIMHWVYCNCYAVDVRAVMREIETDFSIPAFSFVSKERFEQCKYDSRLLEPTLDMIKAFKPEILNLLELLLPKLAAGWELQRGHMFDFGNNKVAGDDSLKISNLDQEKLKKALIHNLSSERAVGSVNYGLKVYGAKQLKLVSSSLVKASASELMEGKKVTPEMRKLVRKDGEIPQILAKWEEEQKALQKKGMDAKDLANLAVDIQRNTDLKELVKVGGPFLVAEDVSRYVDDPNISDAQKNARLYTEVRYARNTSLSLPKSSDVFRLKKKYKNLSTQEYSSNLKTYLNKVTCKVNMDYNDFQSALEILKSSQ